MPRLVLRIKSTDTETCVISFDLSSVMDHGDGVMDHGDGVSGSLYKKIKE